MSDNFFGKSFVIFGKRLMLFLKRQTCTSGLDKGGQCLRNKEKTKKRKIIKNTPSRNECFSVYFNYIMTVFSFSFFLLFFVFSSFFKFLRVSMSLFFFYQKVPFVWVSCYLKVESSLMASIPCVDHERTFPFFAFLGTRDQFSRLLHDSGLVSSSSSDDTVNYFSGNMELVKVMKLCWHSFLIYQFPSTREISVLKLTLTTTWQWHVSAIKFGKQS